MLSDVISSSAVGAEVFRWSDLEAMPQHRPILAAVEDEFGSNLAFRFAVRAQVLENLGSRVA